MKRKAAVKNAAPRTNRPAIGIVGCFQNGKSTLVNCLLDDRVAVTGDGQATTRRSTVFTLGEYQGAFACAAENDVETSVAFAEYLNAGIDDTTKFHRFLVRLWKPLLQHIDVVDTPGFNANDKDDASAIASLDALDIAVLVLQNRGLSEVEHRILQVIGKRELPYIVVMNCRETFGALWNPSSEANARIASEIEARLRNIGHPPHPIVGRFVFPVNLAWFWYASGHLSEEEAPEAKRLLSEVEEHFEGELPKDSFALIAAQSNFLPLRSHLQLVAADMGLRRRQEGRAACRLVEESLAALSEGESDRAMILAERACYRAPGLQAAFHNRATICLNRLEYDEAIDSATRALDIDARNVDSLFVRASAQFGKRDYCSARDDLMHIADLLESDWHIAWDAADKSEQARKYVETYLMKMECDQREGKHDEALGALRHIIDCKQNPMGVLDDVGLQQIVWCLAAGLEFRGKTWERALAAAGNAVAVCTQLKEPCTRLQELCKCFEIIEGDFSVCAPNSSLQKETQLLLWKSCRSVHRSRPMSAAVNEFAERNRLPVHPETWKDEPLFLPHFISIAGSRTDDFPDITLFVSQYFEATGDANLREFCKVAQAGLKDGVLQAFREATRLKCRAAASTMLLGNSVTVTNLGNPVISNLTVEVSYSLDDSPKQKTLRMNEALGNGKQFCWQGVFEGKSAFGSLFGGKKLSDVRIVKVNSEQGKVKIIAV